MNHFIHVKEPPAIGSAWVYDAGDMRFPEGIRVSVADCDSRFVVGKMPDGARIHIRREDWSRHAKPIEAPGGATAEPAADTPPDPVAQFPWPPPERDHCDPDIMRKALVHLASEHNPLVSDNEGVRLLGHLLRAVGKSASLANVLSAALRGAYIEGVNAALDSAAVKAHDMGRADIRWEINHLVSPPRGPMGEPRPQTADDVGTIADRVADRMQAIVKSAFPADDPDQLVSNIVEELQRRGGGGHVPAAVPPAAVAELSEELGEWECETGIDMRERHAREYAAAVVMRIVARHLGL